MTIVWSERAIERLTEIHDYIFQRSPERALELVQKLFDRVELIRAFPESGRVIPRYEALDVREVQESGYRILYRVSADRVEIVNVLHSRQNL